jgi:fructosamine-3-kinase
VVNSIKLLPIISSPEEYREVFKDQSIWDPVFKAIAQRHQLSLNLRRSDQGSHIVYQAGDFWIKLMAPIYEKEMIYEIAGLKSIQNQLSIATPKVLVQDSIEGWPYVVLANVPGEAIKSVWPRINHVQQTELALQIANLLKQISRCKATEIIRTRCDWNQFINNQYDSCIEQQTKKQMPVEWLQNLKLFLSQFQISEFLTDRPVYLHSDLSYDHFLVTEQDNSVLVSGIIDMADVQSGHWEYELAAPCVFIFKGQKQILRSFLSRLGVMDLNQRFSEKLLAWCILHRYFFMYAFFKKEMEDCVAGDFSSLAQRVFPL